MSMRKMIEDTHPEKVHLLWDIVDAKKYSVGSSTAIRWRCPIDDKHEWFAIPYGILKNESGCNICSGHKVQIGVNDLWTVFPKLAEQLADPQLGYKITVGSNKIIEWRCIKNSSHNNWLDSPNNRRCNLRKRKKKIDNEPLDCPVCSSNRLQIGINDLWTVNPSLASELVDSSIGFEVMPKSNRSVEWKCIKYPDIHPNWTALVSNRTVGNGCAICGGHKVLAGFNDIGTVNPRLAEELVDPTLACELMPRSERKVEWQCRINPEHVWPATVSNRTIGRGCPACAKSGYKIGKTAWLYVLVSSEAKNCGSREVVQFGISNSLKSRLEKHRASGFRKEPVLLLEGLGRRVWDVEWSLKCFLRAEGFLSCFQQGISFGRGGGSDETYFTSEVSVERIVTCLKKFDEEFVSGEKFVKRKILDVLPGSRVYKSV